MKIEDLLREARSEARGIFKRAAAEQSDVSFGFAAVHSAWIVRCQDESGAKGWLPVDREAMRLSERVLSLIAVDYLVRPADYLGLLSVCEECERVTFDALCRERRHCHAHRKSVARIFAAQKTSA